MVHCHWHNVKLFSIIQTHKIYLGWIFKNTTILITTIKKKDFTNYHHMDTVVTPENFGVHYFTALISVSETFNGLVKKIKHAKTKTLTIMYQGFCKKQSLTWHHWNK